MGSLSRGKEVNVVSGIACVLVAGVAAMTGESGGVNSGMVNAKGLNLKRWGGIVLVAVVSGVCETACVLVAVVVAIAGESGGVNANGGTV